jgi:hypothetical protein
MCSPRSVWAFAVVAIFAMILAVFAPFSFPAHMVGPQEQNSYMASMPSAMDCETCPKADMALAGCQQMTCQIAAGETDDVHFAVTEAIRYASTSVTRLAQWHTVPPVSPG